MELWDYSGAEIEKMPDDALGLLVLHAYDGEWNVRSFFLAVAQHRSAFWQQPGVPQRIADAWAWIEAHALVGRHPTQDSSDARSITKAGRQVLAGGLGRLRAAERLDVDLHPLLREGARRQFMLGEFELAAFAAMKEVEVRVRALGSFPDDLIGVKLMAEAFSPTAPGPLVDPAAEKGEQEALMALFRGAIGTFKNPLSHRPVDYDDPARASEVVLLADLLMRLLDPIEQRLRDGGSLTYL